jgi:hypothetical protein
MFFFLSLLDNPIYYCFFSSSSFICILPCSCFPSLPPCFLGGVLDQCHVVGCFSYACLVACLLALSLLLLCWGSSQASVSLWLRNERINKKGTEKKLLPLHVYINWLARRKENGYKSERR